jgi:hypothetical protein
VHNAVRNTNALARDHTTDISGRAHSRSQHCCIKNLGSAVVVTRNPNAAVVSGDQFGHESASLDMIQRARLSLQQNQSDR